MQDRNRRFRIGVFIEWLSDGYSDPILQEIVGAAEEQGVDVWCFVGGCSELDFPVAKRHVPLVYASADSIDGAVVVSMGNLVTTSDLELLFQRFEGIPLCGMAIQWTRYPSVDVENESGVRAGIRHLIRKHGCRQIACIRGPTISIEADKRFGAYRDVLREFDLKYDERYVAAGHYVREHGANAVRVFLDERKLSIDAIVAANDAMALGALEELLRRGIRVPESVALLGFDDIDEARHARPPLSTVRQPFREHARKAFELVMDQLEKRSVPQRTQIDSQLILRRSCGCFSSRGWLQSSAPPPRRSSRPAESLDSWVRQSSRALSNFLAPRADTEGLQRDLTTAMLHAASSGDLATFLEVLDRELDRLGENRGDLFLALPLLRSRQKALQGVVGTPSELEHLDNLLWAATALASEAAERLQAQQRYREKTQIHRLLRMNEALLHTTDLDGVARILAEQLPQLGVRGCYVCVWEGAAVPAEWARLVLACDSDAIRQLPPGGQRFLAKEVLPKELRQGDTPSAWLVCPMLRLEPVPTSYVVFALGTAEAFVYDALVDQVGSNFKRLDLMQQLEDVNRQLQIMADTDSLTRLSNRRRLMNEFEVEFERARRQHLDLSFVLIDLDDFKSINDTHGHLTGDSVLERVAALLLRQSPATGRAGRYGGEELCLVLAHTSLEDAVLVAETLRTAIAELEFSADGSKFGITASFGVTQALPEDQTIEEIVRRADRALYRAKTNGRNRVERGVLGQDP